MDIHEVIATAVEEVLDGLGKANKDLEGKAVVGAPSSIEIEFGITSSYEVANYDDLRVATVRARLPLHSGVYQSPATAAVEAEPNKKK